MPPRLWRKPGVHGRFKASRSKGSAHWKARIAVGQPQQGRTPARANGIKQIKHLLFADRRGHGDAGLFNIRDARPQGAGFGDHAGNAEADVVRALVAKHLGRQAGRDGAFHGGRAVGVDELFGQRGEKPRRRRAESDANDVRVHARAFNGGRGLVRIRFAHCKLE